MKKRLNILMPTSCFFPGIGGAQIGFHNLAKKLRELGHNPTMLIPFNSYKYIKEKNWNLGYSILPLPPKLFGIYRMFPFLGSFYFRLYFFIISFFKKFDVCHINLAYPMGTLITSFLSNKIFISIMCAGEDIQIVKSINYGIRLNPKIDKIIKKNINKANKIIALNQGILKTYKSVGINKEKIELIPYGVENSFFKKKTIINKKLIKFLVVGRNHPKKNYTAIIKVAKLLVDKNIKNFKIIFIGKDVSKLKKGIVELKIEPYIRLIDQIGSNKNKKDINKFPSKELLKYYYEADVFLFPSIIELCPVAILEATSAGLPIITSNTPGCRDIVLKNKNAFLVNFKKESEILKSMKKLINNFETRKKMSLRSLNYSENYNLLLIAKKYEKLFMNK